MHVWMYFIFLFYCFVSLLVCIINKNVSVCEDLQFFLS